MFVVPTLISDTNVTSWTVKLVKDINTSEYSSFYPSVILLSSKYDLNSKNAIKIPTVFKAITLAMNFTVYR